MVKYSKSSLSLFAEIFYWFVQYIDDDNGNVRNNQPPLSMEFESFHLEISFLL
jgi:hypothetical protein